MEVSIVIVNYNTFSLTRNCIDSVIDMFREVDYEVIVVDNASSDGSVGKLKAHFDGITVVESKKNLGFGSANNYGAGIAKGDYLLFLNSDCIVLDNALRKMLDFYKEYSDKLNIGVLGSLLQNNRLEVTNSYGVFPTVYKEIFSFFTNRLHKVKDEQSEVNEKNEYFFVDYVSGANMFMHRELFTKVGGFDECFFIYFEETDLQFRLSKIGYRSCVLTIKDIIHLEDGSTDIVSDASQWKRVTFKDSRFKYIRNNDKRYRLFYLFNLVFGILSLLNPKYSIKQNFEFYRTGLF